jgi:hypothetical protein
MDVILALIIVGLAGSFVGRSYYKKFMQAQSAENRDTCACSGTCCDRSRQCDKQND